MRHLLNTEFLGLDFSAVASSFLSGSHSIISAAPGESEPESDGAVLLRSLGHLLLRISMNPLQKAMEEALDLPLVQKREELGTRIGMSAQPS